VQQHDAAVAEQVGLVLDVDRAPLQLRVKMGAVVALAQAAAEDIFGEIKALYAGLDEHGRAGARAKARVGRTRPA
jgi:hypothetical protein